MANDAEFSRILTWIERLNSSLEAAEAEGRSTRNLLESAEYELALLRRQLETVPPAPDAEIAPESASTAPSTGDAGTGFNEKLRHPSRAWQRLWAA